MVWPERRRRAVGIVLAVAVLAGFWLLAPSASAQAHPAADGQVAAAAAADLERQDPEPAGPSELERPHESESLPESERPHESEGPPEPVGPEEPLVFVRRLDVGPSAWLTEAEIGAIRAKYEGQQVSVAQLLGIVDDFDALYASKGYLAKAVLPEQTIEDGVVRIELVEARIGTLTLQGNQFTRDDYILARLGAGPGDLLDLGRLDAALTYFNRTNDVKLHAQLAPGQAVGTSDVLVLVEEPPRDQWQLLVNVPGSQTHRLSASVTWRRNSVTGRRDVMSLNVMHAPGTWSGTASYQVPVGLDGVRFGLAQHDSWVDVLEHDGTPTPIHRRTSQTTLSLSQPMVLSETAMSMASLEWHHRRLDVSVAGVPQSTMTEQALTAAYTIERQMPGRAWMFNAGLRGGVSRTRLGGTEYEPRSYRKLTLAGQSIWVPAPIHRWLVRGTLQHGFDNTAPDDERFSLGGPSTVRGIREGAAADHRGYAVSLEYWHTANDRVEIVAFVDHGRVWPANGSGTTTASFTSMGLGVDWRPSPAVLVTLVMGVPLGQVEDSLRELLHAQVQVSF